MPRRYDLYDIRVLQTFTGTVVAEATGVPMSSIGMYADNMLNGMMLEIRLSEDRPDFAQHEHRVSRMFALPPYRNERLF